MSAQYCIALLIGCFWAIYELFQQLLLIIRYRTKYFCNQTFVSYPKSLYSSKYQHKFAPLANGITLHYVSCGNPTAPLMLLVHGFPEFWYSWRHQLDHFKDKYHVVAVDLRGYGLSDKPQHVSQYKTTLLVDDLFHLLKHLEASKCVLVGHDWGGAITWRFAQRYPHMVQSLIVLNCPQPAAFMRYMHGHTKQFLKSWYMFLFQLPYLPEWKFTQLACQGTVDAFVKLPWGMRLKQFSEEEQQAFRANFMIPGAATAAINFYRAAFRYSELEPATVDKSAPPKSLYPADLPCLLVWGEEDGALCKEMALESVKYCAQLKVEYVPGASHWVQQDAPEVVNRAMEKFLKK